MHRQPNVWRTVERKSRSSATSDVRATTLPFAALGARRYNDSECRETELSGGQREHDIRLLAEGEAEHTTAVDAVADRSDLQRVAVAAADDSAATNMDAPDGRPVSGLALSGEACGSRPVCECRGRERGGKGQRREQDQAGTHLPTVRPQLGFSPGIRLRRS